MVIDELLVVVEADRRYGGTFEEGAEPRPDDPAEIIAYEVPGRGMVYESETGQPSRVPEYYHQ